MTNFYVTYKMTDKKSRDEYYERIRDLGIIAKCRGEEGCIRYDFFFPAESDNELFLWEQWESRNHQIVHTTTNHFKEMVKIKEEYEIKTTLVAEDALEEDH